MPVHDWTRVEAGIFHDFHVAWIPELRKSLNGGVLPEGFYALAEQHAGRSSPDLLTLHESDPADNGLSSLDALPRRERGTAVATSPPGVRRHQTVAGSLLMRQRTLAIRHVSGHRLVAIIEILSAANKDRAQTLATFTGKVLEALCAGVHVLFVDLFPPGPLDPQGVHGVILRQLSPEEPPYDLPPAEPLTVASYGAGQDIDMYVEHMAVGAKLPEMPLFLTPGRYVNAPLEATYLEAYRGMPKFWREVVEGRAV